MRRYETVFIVNPELSEDQRQPLFDKLNGLVPEDQGMLVKLDEWGSKRLAYVIKKHTRGYYVLMDFCGDGALVKEIERNLRLDDRVLKYMTVLKDETVDLEAVKAEMEAATIEAANKEAATIEAAKKEAAKKEAATPEPSEVAEEAATPEPSEVTEEATRSEPAEIATGEGEEGTESEATDAEETPADEAEEPKKTAATSNQEEQ